jgi:hypothetical protein
VIADSPVGPQAFVAGRSLGLQFHPEVTTQIMDDWVRVYAHELEGDGIDPGALLEETIGRRARASGWPATVRPLPDRVARPSTRTMPATGRRLMDDGR